MGTMPMEERRVSQRYLGPTGNALEEVGDDPLKPYRWCHCTDRDLTPEDHVMAAVTAAVALGELSNATWPAENCARTVLHDDTAVFKPWPCEDPEDLGWHIYFAVDGALARKDQTIADWLIGLGYRVRSLLSGPGDHTLDREWPSLP